MLIKNFNSYPWKYCSLGGVVRVNIASGDDIAHLGELDRKLWTVLSCPTANLEFPQETLKLLDTDADGKIKVDEVISAAGYLTSIIKDRDGILQGASVLPFSQFNEEDGKGKTLLEAARHILRNLGLEKEEIALEDTADSVRIFADTAFNGDGIITVKSTEDAKLQKLITAISVIEGAATDRCGLPGITKDHIVKFFSDLDAFLAWTPAPEAGEEPVVYPFGDGTAAAPAAFESFKAEFPGLDAKDGSKAALLELVAEDSALAAESASMDEVRKLLLLYRDFYTFLKNYVLLTDFYSPDSGERAVFEAGELYIDQRCCKLCIRVEDMSKHADIAAQSGMFLLYCTCVSKSKGATMNIVAVMTAGSMSHLFVGKNGIFYSRDGSAWDAVVTKIVDNPINVSQAFWRPYKKLAQFISDKIDKSAADKDSAATENLLAAVDKADPAAQKQPFDIAKFAGVFAAIGVALGSLGAGLGLIVNGLKGLPWWQYFVLLAAIMLVISGPSCFISWRKIRHRNLGPVLNANGWAINSVILVNAVFGRALTKVATYPHLKLKDPYYRKAPLWWRILSIILTLAVIAFFVLFFMGKLECIGIPFNI